MSPLDLEAIPVAGDGVRTLAAEGDTSPVVERLRARHEALTKDTHLDVDIPGYGGILVARYRRFKGKEMDELRADASDLLEYNLAFLVEACEQMFGREDDGTLTALGEGVVPVRYDAVLARILDLKAESAREVLLGVFADNDLGVRAHGDEVALWMVNGRDDLGK